MNVWQMSGSDIALTIKQKQISSVEVIEAFLSHIDDINGDYNGFSILNELALELAKEADDKLSRGEEVGVLHGVPFTVKDVLDTKDLPNTYCSRAFENNRPEYDTAAVARMREAGGILLGKTTSPDFAAKITTSSALFGVTRNPWSIDRSAGGSSGGAGVTVSKGMGPLAISTDGGGSSRVPASACGILGLKPTLGAVPCETWPFLFANNSTTSVNTRCLADLVLMWNTITGEHAMDPWSRREIRQLEEPRGETNLLKNKKALFVPEMAGNKADEEILAAVEETLVKLESIGLGVELADSDLISFDASIFPDMMSANLAARFRLMTKEQQALLDPAFRPLLDPTIYKCDGVKLQMQAIERSCLYERLERIFQQYDYVITPTTMAKPPFAERGSDNYVIINGEQQPIFKWWSHLSLPNMTGHPAISIPCGFTADNLPIGLHSIGRWDCEQSLVNLACGVHNLNPWTDLWP
jgi:aspartyl-tRNA(Asn)/glutamyl-tRNA(Gln) amidotransferase subunit A